MSSERDSIHQFDFDPNFFYNHHELNSQSCFQSNPNSIYNHRSTTPQQDQFDPSHTGFAEYLQGSMDYSTLSRAFDLSCSSSEVIPSVDGHSKISAGRDGVRVCGSTQSTLNSSVSSSSNEAEVVEIVEDSQQCKKDKQSMECEDQGEDKSKKGNKPNKEKKPRAPRFAFLTKSDVDHLEDGYRWRKYGQKAVKNSPYPRSYYRCTTQKCVVKKRVERSFQDPSVVITTYEGQHNHHAPATLRSNATAMLSSPLFSSSSAAPSNLPQDLLVQLLPIHNRGDYVSSLHQNYFITPNHQQQLFQFHQYGLSQDSVPSFSHEEDQ